MYKDKYKDKDKEEKAEKEKDDVKQRKTTIVILINYSAALWNLIYCLFHGNYVK